MAPDIIRIASPVPTSVILWAHTSRLPMLRVVRVFALKDANAFIGIKVINLKAVRLITLRAQG